MKVSNRVILFLILLAAGILRFVDYVNVPFTYDEFSALFRLNFDSFRELIEYGVKIDGHPAGVHVFLFYWTQFLGCREWVVKLPFTFMGILSVLFIYLIAKKWMNETVGLLAAAYLASIQFTVMYSQIARPYISGLFFSLLMVYFWSNLVISANKHFYRNAVGFVISAALCAYNHHFSLLFAAIVGFSGLFFIPRKFRLKYIIAGALIFVLYIPHLQIFWYQLGIGGVENWLAKPRWDFTFNFLGYIFNFSWFSMLVAIAIVIYGFGKHRMYRVKTRNYILFLCWFLLPLIVGFVYSVFARAVLQYSVLIFSFPFLFFLLFGHIKTQKPIVNLVLVAVILLVNTATLVFGRKHYQLFYESPYKEILVDYQKVGQEYDSTLYLIDSHHGITGYYSDRMGLDTHFVWYDSLGDDIALKAWLEKNSSSYNTFFLGCLSSNPPLTIPMIKEYFPRTVWQNHYAGGSAYLFAVGPSDEETVEILGFESDFDICWSRIKSAGIIDSISYLGMRSYRIDSLENFGPTYSQKLSHIIDNKNDFIDISVWVKPTGVLENAFLVVSLEINGHMVFWTNVDVSRYISADQNHHDWFKVYYSLKLSDLNRPLGPLLFKTYIWNKGKETFFLDDFCIKVRKGNPVIYGLYEKL